MAITTTSNKVIYSGNGVTTAWSYTFPIPDASSLVVIYTDTAGTETTLSSSVYSVTGLGTTTGGTVTYPTSGSPIATGTKLTILRTVPYTQPDVFSNQGGYFPEVTEGRLDRIVMALQQLYERSVRSFLVPSSDSTAPGSMPTSTQRANGGAGSFLAFNSSGDPYAATLTALSGVSTWVQNTLLPAASALAARGALLVPGLSDNNTYTGTNSFNNGLTLGGGVFTGVGSQSVQSFAGAVVTVPTIGAFANGPNTGSIGASGQVWKITGEVTYVNSSGGNMTATIDLYDGTNSLTTKTGAAATGFSIPLTVSRIVTLTGATTFTVRATDNVGGNLGYMATSASYGAANKATSITAERLA